MAIEHPHVSLSAPVVHRDPETLDVIETPKRDAGPNYSSHLPEFSDAQAESIRDDIIKYNKDQPPEVLARKLADFDRVAKADGVAVDELINPEVRAAFKEAGLKPDPSPLDYRFEVPAALKDLAPDNIAGVAHVTTELMAELGVPAAVGNSLISRIVEVGALQKTMTPEQRQAWKDQQESLGLKIFHSKAALAAVHAKAARVLSEASDNAFTRDLKNSLVMSDITFLSSLATHADIADTLIKKARE